MENNGCCGSGEAGAVPARGQWGEIVEIPGSMWGDEHLVSRYSAPVEGLQKEKGVSVLHPGHLQVDRGALQSLEQAPSVAWNESNVTICREVANSSCAFLPLSVTTVAQQRRDAATARGDDGLPVLLGSAIYQSHDEVSKPQRILSARLGTLGYTPDGEIAGAVLAETEGGCEEEVYVSKDDGVEDPPEDELEKVLKVVADNIANLLAGVRGYVVVTLPDGTERWYQVERAGAKEWCHGSIVVKLLKERPFKWLTRRGMSEAGIVVVEIKEGESAGGTGASEPLPPDHPDPGIPPGVLPEEPPEEPPPPKRPEGDTGGGGAIPAPSLPGDAASTGGTPATPTGSLSKPLPDDAEDYDDVSSVYSCAKEGRYRVRFTNEVVTLDVFRRSLVWRQAYLPSDEEVKKHFESDTEKVRRGFAGADYTAGLSSYAILAGLPSAILGHPNAQCPAKCPDMTILGIDAWSIEITAPHVVGPRLVSSTAIKHPDTGVVRGYEITVQYEIRGTIEGEIWFRYRCDP